MCGQMRRAARVDENQAVIVAALRDAGALVWPTHQLGGGFPDLCVGFRNELYLLEVKDGSKPPSARTLTEDEFNFFAMWDEFPVWVVKDIDEALEAIGAI